MDPSVAPLESQFNIYSWMIIVAYVIFTTWFGHKMSGKQATIRDFFLGGRKLPWYAVSGSIIATEISAMTLVGVPAFLWAKTGNMAYMVLAIGGILGRIVVAMFFVPAYYEQEIYSPYQYIGNKLGMRAQRVTSSLFMLGGALGQGTRVLLTAMVAHVITGLNIYYCIWIVGFVAVAWTFIGGIVTVIWTDVIQFIIFLFSAIVTLVAVFIALSDHGIALSTMLSDAYQAGKFEWLNFSFDIRENYTFWTAAIASTIGGLAAYGVDQMMVQRCFCCKNAHEAKKAIISSCVGQVIMVICLLVGVALWFFYQRSGLVGVPSPAESGYINDSANNILPVFIKYRLPWFIGGVIVAGVFAAAISSLEGILAALSEQTLYAARTMGFNVGDDRRSIHISRMMIIVWGIILCGIASIFWAAWQGSGLIIELALSVVGLSSGAILATFLMAIVPKWRREAFGMEYAASLSVLTIFALMQHTAVNNICPTCGLSEATWAITRDYFAATWAIWTLIIATIAVLFFAIFFRMKKDKFVLVKMLPFFAIIYFIQLYQFQGPAGETYHITVGWPWYTPIGMVIMLVASMILCRKQQPEDKEWEALSRKQTQSQ